MSDELVDFKVERPDCHHMQTIFARPQQSIADYNARLVPELREAIQKPCEQCAEEKAKLAKQKLDQDLRAKK